jgi:uncharacterized protein with PIN domain
MGRAWAAPVIAVDTSAIVAIVLGDPERAFVAYGKGSGHPASLNFGDLFAYALAKVQSLPLLFKGDDFVHTDIQSASTVFAVG